jgi:hypothetical protein
VAARVRRTPAALVDQVAIEREEAHRVHVEDGAREALEPLGRVVAGDRQHVADPAPLELSRERQQAIATPVSAGHVDDDILPTRQELLGEERRARHRVAAGVVGDRDRRDPRIVHQRMRGGEAGAARPVGHGTPPGDQLRHRDELVGGQQALPEAGHSRTRPAECGVVGSFACQEPSQALG